MKIAQTKNLFFPNSNETDNQLSEE